MKSLSELNSRRNKRHASRAFSSIILFSIVIVVGLLGLTQISKASSTPTVPTNLAIYAVTTSTITVTWSPSTESGGTVTGYALYRNGVFICDSTVTNHTNLNLAPGTTYSYTVAAYDASGHMSAQSASVNGTTLGVPIPTVPGSLAIYTTTTSTITVTWSPSTESGGTVTGYALYRNGVFICDSTVTNHTNLNLAPGTTYSYTVAAYDSNGRMSLMSNNIAGTTRSITPLLNQQVGMSVGETLMGLNSATLNSQLNDMASIGITWLRADFEWSHVQPNNSTQYNWSDIDSFVAAANAHHMKILAVLDYTPTWAETPTCAAAQNSDRCPPANPSQFATFAAAAVARYAPQGILDWEIWNEPNLSSNWEPAADANGYTALLKSVYPAIKGQSSSALVITGGMAPSADTLSSMAPITFLSDLYADGAEGFFDAVSFHPYSYPTMPLNFYIWNAWSQMASTSPSLRSVMTANGDSGKKIWMTEYGAPTGGPGVLEASPTDTQFIGGPDHVTEALQSQMLSQAISATEADPWAGPLFIYSYKDLGTSESTNENFFGILRYDGSTKPVYTTIKNFLM